MRLRFFVALMEQISPSSEMTYPRRKVRGCKWPDLLIVIALSKVFSHSTSTNSCATSNANNSHRRNRLILYNKIFIFSNVLSKVMRFARLKLSWQYLQWRRNILIQSTCINTYSSLNARGQRYSSAFAQTIITNDPSNIVGGLLYFKTIFKFRLRCSFLIMLCVDY